MPETIRPDICVIGAGAGGPQVAVLAAGFGVRVVLVDPAPGGQTGAAAIRAGHLPLSALAAAAARAHLAARAPDLGVQAKSIRSDFGRVRAHVQAVMAARAPNVAPERLAGLGVRVIAGAARFRDAGTLAVAGDIEIAARRFVIATGSSPALPPIAGLDTVACLTTETALDLSHCPEHLIIIGAGPIGLEFAQAFRRLGAEVTVLDAAAPLASHDPECAAVVLDQLAREGIRLRRGAIARVAEEQWPTQPQSKLQVLFNDVLRAGRQDGEETIEGSHLMVAGGRWANVVGLGLDAAGIKFDEHGIAVDKALRTSNRRVYAIGDVTGDPQPAHVAEHQAGLVVRNALFRLPVRFDPDSAPRVTFTDPELAQTGLTEAAARGRRHRVRVLRWPYRENDRAHAEAEVRGHIKVVTTASGRILGVTIVGAGAGELITAWTLAISQGLNIRAFAGIVVPYPTLAEIGKWAGATYLMSGLTSPWVRRIIALLRRFG